MDKTRFLRMNKEEKTKLTLEDFTVSEINEIIEETAMSEVNREIARLRFTKSMTAEAIAERVDRDEKTVKRNLPTIRKKLSATIRKII